MSDFEDWLNRKPAGPKPRKPLKRTRVNKVSARHRNALKEYYDRRRGYLEAHPICEAGPVIARAKLPAAYRVPVCGVKAVQVHHTRGRGPYLNDEATFCGICPACHVFVHAHGQWARAVGLLY